MYDVTEIVQLIAHVEMFFSFNDIQALDKNTKTEGDEKSDQKRISRIYRYLQDRQKLIANWMLLESRPLCTKICLGRY